MSLAPLDLENSSGALNQPKVIYAGDAYQGQPYIVVTEDNIILVGDANTVVRPGPSRPAHIYAPRPREGPAGSSSIEPSSRPAAPPPRPSCRQRPVPQPLCFSYSVPAGSTHAAVI